MIEGLAFSYFIKNFSILPSFFPQVYIRVVDFIYAVVQISMLLCMTFGKTDVPHIGGRLTDCFWWFIWLAGIFKVCVDEFRVVKA